MKETDLKYEEYRYVYTGADIGLNRPVLYFEELDKIIEQALSKQKGVKISDLKTSEFNIQIFKGHIAPGFIVLDQRKRECSKSDQIPIYYDDFYDNSVLIQILCNEENKARAKELLEELKGLERKFN